MRMSSATGFEEEVQLPPVCFKAYCRSFIVALMFESTVDHVEQNLFPPFDWVEITIKGVHYKGDGFVYNQVPSVNSMVDDATLSQGEA